MLVLIVAVAVVIAGAVFAIAWLVFDDDSDSVAGRGSKGTPTSTSDTTANSTSPAPTSSSVTPSGQAKGAVPIGVWAGDRMVLTVTKSGADAEFECASGILDGPLLTDASGHFDASGSYRAQSRGPARPGTQQPPVLRARFSGSTQGAVMDLTVVLTDTGTTHGPFHLKLNGPITLQRCL